MENTLTRVVNCLAAATRYPIHLLTPTADLENDLGIDSVKRVEIAAALADEFNLPFDVQERDPAIRTIGQVAGWVDSFLNRSPNVSNNGHSKTPNGVAHNGAGHNGVVHQNGSTRRDPQQSVRVHHSHDVPPSLSLNPVTDQKTSITAQSSPLPLQGRVALVTGSGRGIGQTTARFLSSRGATVIVNSFHSRQAGEDTAESIRAAGGNATHLWGSVAKPDHVDQIFDQIQDQFGFLDILVCNASDGRIGSFTELNQDDWDRAFRTNVSGHHQCAVRGARLMHGRGGGSIVTMSAVGAHRFIDGLGSQGVVKAAVEALTRYLACELAAYNVRANCVAAGPVYGELISKFQDARTVQNHWESITPGGQLTSPMDVARTIAFLVSDEAQGINGAVWQVDQGFSARDDGRPMAKTLARKGVPAHTLEV